MSSKRAMMIGLDGADPMVVKRLIASGRLPGMKRVLERGCATEDLNMLGVFPTVTPPNWASLATGNWPRTHGITDFMCQTVGKPLDMLEINWDSRRIASQLIWEKFEEEGRRALMLNYCEAWPNRVPESKNVFIDGSGVVPYMRTFADYQKIIELTDEPITMQVTPHTISASSNDCVVYGDQLAQNAHAEAAVTDITDFMVGAAFSSDEALQADQPLLEQPAVVLMDFSAEGLSTKDVADHILSPLKAPVGWSIALPPDAKEAALVLNNGLARRYVLISQSTGHAYDTISFYTSKKGTPAGVCQNGQWSQWIYDRFLVNETEIPVAYKIRVMEMAPDGSSAKFYLSHVTNLDDHQYDYPPEIGQALIEHVGPFMNFATIDRYTPLGDAICLESWEMIMDWHIRAARYLFETYPDWGLFYTHLHGIDLANHWYINEAIPDSHPHWQANAENIDRMYEIQDQFVLAMLDYLDDQTNIFITSDHGAIPRSVGYENPGIGEISGLNAKVLSELGYTVIHEVPGVKNLYTVDLEKSRAVNARGSHIMINLKGRDPSGIVEPADYEKTVQQLISDLYAYRDPVHGERVVSFCMTREEMESIGMGGEHSGDIFFQLTRDFGLEHAFAPPHVTNHGYSLGCLCLMCGADIAPGRTLVRPIRTVDIVPTICHVCQVPMPADVEGGVIYQALKS